MKVDPFLDPRVIESLRSRVLDLPKRSNGIPIKIEKTLRTEILSAFKRSGMRLADFAAKISVSSVSIRSWSKASSSPRKDQKSNAFFQKVAFDISPNKETLRPTGLIVEGPSGLRIAGMTAGEIAVLWRQLC